MIGQNACLLHIRADCAVVPVQGDGASGVKKLVEKRGLLQISDPAQLQAIVDTVLAASPEKLEQYRGGKTKLQSYFVGCVQIDGAQTCCEQPCLRDQLVAVLLAPQKMGG